MFTRGNAFKKTRGENREIKKMYKNGIQFRIKFYVRVSNNTNYARARAHIILYSIKLDCVCGEIAFPERTTPL